MVLFGLCCEFGIYSLYRPGPSLQKNVRKIFYVIDLDEWLHYYNNERTHQGKMCCGRTPMETLIDGKQIWQEKFIH